MPHGGQFTLDTHDCTFTHIPVTHAGLYQVTAAPPHHPMEGGFWAMPCHGSSLTAPPLTHYAE